MCGMRFNEAKVVLFLKYARNSVLNCIKWAERVECFMSTYDFFVQYGYQWRSQNL